MLEYYGKFLAHGLTLSEIHRLKTYCWETLLGWTATVAAIVPLIVNAANNSMINDPIVIGACAGIAVIGLIVAISGMIPLYREHNLNQTELGWKIFAYTPKKGDTYRPSLGAFSR